MNIDKNFIKFTSLIVILSLIVIVGTSIVSNIILGYPVVKLSSAQFLQGQISQSIIVGTGGNKILSTANYLVVNPVYFDNGSWAVAQFVPQKNSGDITTVVMQKVGPYYQVVIGPGTSFPSNIQQSLPTDLYTYLQTKGLILQSGD